MLEHKTRVDWCFRRAVDDGLRTGLIPYSDYAGDLLCTASISRSSESRLLRYVPASQPDAVQPIRAAAGGLPPPLKHAISIFRTFLDRQ